jgi:hypothetical protein
MIRSYHSELTQQQQQNPINGVVLMGSATSKFPSNFSCAVVVAAPP